MVVALAFDLGAERMVADCDARNTASERVMQSLGMSPQKSTNPNRRSYGLTRNPDI
jgi:RimJ/RimL family protein N-acetyltransferase